MIFLDVSTHTFLSIMSLGVEFLGHRVIRRFLKKIYQNTADRPHEIRQIRTGVPPPLSLAWDLSPYACLWSLSSLTSRFFRVLLQSNPSWPIFPLPFPAELLQDSVNTLHPLSLSFHSVSNSPTRPLQPLPSHSPPECLAAGAEGGLPVDTGFPGVMGLQASGPSFSNSFAGSVSSL